MIITNFFFNNGGCCRLYRRLLWPLPAETNVPNNCQHTQHRHTTLASTQVMCPTPKPELNTKPHTPRERPVPGWDLARSYTHSRCRHTSLPSAILHQEPITTFFSLHLKCPYNLCLPEAKETMILMSSLSQCMKSGLAPAFSHIQW